MSESTQFVAIFVALAAGFVFCILNLTVAAVLRVRRPYAEKLETYECGEEAVGSAWIRYNVRFYILALAFVIFDVELLLVLPIAVVYRDLLAQGLGSLVLIEAGIFIAILLLGLVYILRKKDLDWQQPMMADEGKG